MIKVGDNHHFLLCAVLYAFIFVHLLSVSSGVHWTFQVPSGEPFQNDVEKEKYYTDLLRLNMVDCIEDFAVEREMETAAKEHDQAGADLGIFPKAYNALAVDPSQLTRWIIGEERLLKL